MNHLVSGIDVWHWRQQAIATTKITGIDPYEVDWLLQALGCDRLALQLGLIQEQSHLCLARSLEDLEQLWYQRIQARVPVQYLLGQTPWRNFSLAVSPAVLIPRPETECMIDLVARSTGFSKGHWADLGTGSGAIALALALLFPQATIHAVDCSEAALQVAQQNAQSLHLQDQIQFYLGSWFEPIAHLQGQLCGLLANPPYIPTALIETLQPEVAWHEPHLALDGGSDGLACIRQLVKLAPDYLTSGGLWLVEIMAGQAPQVVELLQRQGDYTDSQVHADLAGIDRFVMAYRQ